MAAVPVASATVMPTAVAPLPVVSDGAYAGVAHTPMSPPLSSSSAFASVTGPLRHASSPAKHHPTSPYAKPLPKPPAEAKPPNKGRKHLGYLTEWTAATPAQPPAAPAPPAVERPQLCPVDMSYQMSVLDQLGREQEARVKAAMTALLNTWQAEQKRYNGGFISQCSTMMSECNNLDQLASSACAIMSKLPQSDEEDGSSTPGSSAAALDESDVYDDALEERAAQALMRTASRGSRQAEQWDKESDKDSSEGTQAAEQSDGD